MKDYLGVNDKTKVVVKLSTVGTGPPVREPGMSEDERKHLMLMEHRRREEIKRLLEDNDDNYLDQVTSKKILIFSLKQTMSCCQDWASGKQLAQSLQGVKDISWKPRF